MSAKQAIGTERKTLLQRCKTELRGQRELEKFSEAVRDNRETTTRCTKVRRAYATWSNFVTRILISFAIFPHFLGLDQVCVRSGVTKSLRYATEPSGCLRADGPSEALGVTPFPPPPPLRFEAKNNGCALSLYFCFMTLGRSCCCA